MTPVAVLAFVSVVLGAVPGNVPAQAPEAAILDFNVFESSGRLHLHELVKALAALRIVCAGKSGRRYLMIKQNQNKNPL